jgi:hypothetical protein
MIAPTTSKPPPQPPLTLWMGWSLRIRGLGSGRFWSLLPVDSAERHGPTCCRALSHCAIKGASWTGPMPRRARVRHFFFILFKCNFLPSLSCANTEVSQTLVHVCYHFFHNHFQRLLVLTRSLYKCKELVHQVALDNRNYNEFSPLYSTAIYPKPDHALYVS